VNATATSFDADGMLEMEHLVVQKIFDGAAWRVRTVEYPADDDGVVGGIVVAQHATGVVSRPGKRGAPEESMEEPGIERLEDFIEVVMVADGSGQALAATSLTNMFCLAGDGFGGYVSAVAVGVGGRDWLFIELGEEDVRNCLMNGLGRRLKQV